MVAVLVWWAYRKPDPMTYFQQSQVTDLTVTLADGSPLPFEMKPDDRFVVLIRFRPTDQVPELQDSAYFFVLNEKQHHSDKLDVFEVYRQYPQGAERPVTFTVQEKGSEVNVAPPPPARDALYQQWCAWITPKSLEHHTQPGRTLEMDLWLYPKRDPADTTRQTGIWIFRHLFQLSKQ